MADKRQHSLALVRSLVVAVSFLGTAGCFFPTTLEVTVLGGVVFISVNGNSTTCNPEGDPDARTFDCTFFGETISRVVLSELELTALLVFLDPLVLQVPTGSTDFAASFLHQPSGTSGPLVVTPGLSSVRADATRTITAEPGMQLVVIDFPAGAPTTGDFSFNLNFRPPSGMAMLPMKGLFAGRVETGGETFLAPLYPCTTDLAAIPAVSIPLPAGGTVTLPVGNVSGCANEVYRFGTSVSSVPIPTLPQWGLLLLALALGVLGVRRLMAQPMP
jgi:hypothetical protein